MGAGFLLGLLLLGPLPESCGFPGRSMAGRAPAQYAQGCRTISFDVLLLHKSENDFRSLTEWLTGRRVPEGRWALRSDGARRGGFYWVLRFSRPLSSREACCCAVLKYLRRGSLEAQERRFEFGKSRPRRAGELYLGMTDDASLRNPDDVVAWCVELRDASGKVTAEKRSFLWSTDEADASREDEGPERNEARPAED